MASTISEKVDHTVSFIYLLTLSIKRHFEKVSIKLPVLSFFQILEALNDKVL